MTQTDVIEVGREALITLLIVGSPVMLIALAVGLVISLVQALTQMQEMTLSFVPKILLIFVSLILLIPFMITSMLTFGERLFDRMVSLGL